MTFFEVVGWFVCFAKQFLMIMNLGAHNSFRVVCFLDSFDCNVLALVIILIMFVVKFLRAHGGCLGIGSRRRTWESAISLEESITGR